MTTPSTDPAPPTDALALLRADHQQVRYLFQVLHHVEEEETTMFPEAEALLAPQMDDLATAMWALQRQLRAS